MMARIFSRGEDASRRTLYRDIRQMSHPTLEQRKYQILFTGKMQDI